MHLFHESHSALLSWDIWWYLQTFYDIYLDCLFSVFFWIVFFCIRIFCIRIFFSLDICGYLLISSVYFRSSSESSPSSVWGSSSLSWTSPHGWSWPGLAFHQHYKSGSLFSNERLPFDDVWNKSMKASVLIHEIITKWKSWETELKIAKHNLAYS